jgi:hypothetical protein
VRRLDYTANESHKSYSAKTIKMDDSSANSYARSAIAPLPLLQNLFARLPNSQGRIECVPRAARQKSGLPSSSAKHSIDGVGDA